MRDYSKVGPQFWIGETGKKLKAAGAETTIVALYLMTSPHSNMLGLYYLPIPYLVHETGLGTEGAREGLIRAIEAGFCRYDEASEMVWVLEMAAYQIAPSLKLSDKRCSGVQNDYDALPKNPFLSDFYARYGEAFCMTKERVVERSTSRPSGAPHKPLASQEQEQEQEQAQEQSPELRSGRRDLLDRDDPKADLYALFRDQFGSKAGGFTNKFLKAIGTPQEALCIGRQIVADLPDTEARKSMIGAIIRDREKANGSEPLSARDRGDAW